MKSRSFVSALLSMLLGLGSGLRVKGQEGPPAAPFKHSLTLVEKGSYLELPTSPRRLSRRG